MSAEKHGDEDDRSTLTMTCGRHGSQYPVSDPTRVVWQWRKCLKISAESDGRDMELSVVFIEH